MRTAFVAALAAALVTVAAAGAATSSVNVAPATLSYKQAMSACPGALAGVTFTLNHLRVAELPGVTTDLDATDPTAQTLVLTSASGASATVTVNAAAHTVAGKNVKLSGKSVACVSAG